VTGTFRFRECGQNNRARLERTRKLNTRIVHQAAVFDGSQGRKALKMHSLASNKQMFNVKHANWRPKPQLDLLSPFKTIPQFCKMPTTTFSMRFSRSGSAGFPILSKAAQETASYSA
jgi:S-adenosylmethionine:diacylglycerol 3-amino-3-carboxypropyl transferase